MRIDRLRAKNVRNFRDVELQPGARLNVISGPNAAGKTTLLEAIHLLARARSFRTACIEEVVHRQTPGLQITARIEHGEDGRLDTGIERGEGRWMLRYAGETVKSISAHARKFPLVLVTPDSQQLLLGEPKLRRHWLDWSLFHVEQGYVALWREYHRALRHRNHLLKVSAPGSELEVWEVLMGRSGEALDAARRQFIENLQQELTGLYRTLALGDTPAIGLEQGWRAEGGLGEELLRNRRADLQTGHTRCGPHRADVSFRISEADLAAWYSRGQCKEFIVLLMLAQAAVFAACTGEEPLFLVDDFAAEMDGPAQVRLFGLLESRRGQSFLTCAQAAEAWGSVCRTTRFHVEHGAVAKC
ncbi:MAG: DNA replication and repair protein RecF [Gammaproteobacteria bacterium]|nr:DNA replication and repair protein RecF [Gammaproteobacteria bacterium]